MPLADLKKVKQVCWKPLNLVDKILGAESYHTKVCVEDKVLLGPALSEGAEVGNAANGRHRGGPVLVLGPDLGPDLVVA